jgi:hypothetical protein
VYNTTQMQQHLISYYIGILIVLLSHLHMLMRPTQMFTMKQHAYLNILAAVLIAYYFMNKEGFIKF